MSSEIINPYPYYIKIHYDRKWTLKYCLRVVNDARYDPNKCYYFGRWDWTGINAWIEAYQPPSPNGDNGDGDNGERPSTSLVILIVMFLLVVLGGLYLLGRRKK